MGWAERDAALAQLASRQLFFVGGAPRSGTTWLQQLLDRHPEMCCRGEGLFMKHLAEPLRELVAQRRAALQGKNERLFRHTGGFLPPDAEDARHLTGTAILLALARQCGGQEFRAVGEKTPENVFHLRELHALFPAARFIVIARDPRDVLTSAWHFFHQAAPGEDEAAAKLAFVQSALPSLNEGARATLDFARAAPQAMRVITYEALRAAPAAVMTELFRFLEVSADPAVVADCVASTDFAVQAGRPAGQEDRGSFFRKGVVGDWRSTLGPEVNALMLRELGWMFPTFGWVE